MKERPILFSGPMVTAILEGRKTQTRRVIKPQPNEQLFSAMINHHSLGRFYTKGVANHPSITDVKNPYGKPGDRLWVRETFKPTHPVMDARFIYRADLQAPDLGKPWKPSIFMPRGASRITLEITNVRVERLNNISEDDAWAEGVTVEGFEYATQAFRNLWEEINGKKHPWASNPWVWGVEFKRVTEQ